MADSLNTWVNEIESYLADLEPAQRATIVLKLDVQLRKLPLKSYEELVRTLGTPEQVANGFRLHHGKNPFEKISSAISSSQNSIVSEHYRQSHHSSRPVGTSARRFFKYATYAILSLFVLFVASIFLIPLIIFKFIAVDNFEKDFSFTFGGDQKSRMERFQGKLSAQPLTSLTLSVSNGQVAVVADNTASEIVYECEIEGDQTVNEAEAAKINDGNATITLLNVENADCDLTVPRNMQLSVNVTSGRIALSGMEQNVEANLTNGEIEFEASSKSAFEMTANVQAGSVDGLKAFQESHQSKKGPQYSAVLSVGSGRIDLE